MGVSSSHCRESAVGGTNGCHSVPTKTKARPRRRRTSWTTSARRTSQLIFAGFILVASVRHGLGLESNALASIDALCPFGGAETLWTWITTGRFVAMTHPSNLILGVGLLVGVLLAGNAFCGWICPFGAYIERFWCKYLCPLGAVLSVTQHLSFLRIRRAEEGCKGCALCETPCPMGIEVASANPAVSADCIQRMTKTSDLSGHSFLTD
jgi:polyferredoxin